MPARSYRRTATALRPVRITRGFTGNAHGSVLIEFGRTRVLCTAMLEAGAPKFKIGTGSGWITAEYGMLPGATPQRKERKTDGRATEIQRFIGRALRAVARMEYLGENTVWIDCDVIEADGGTRTAAITGAYVALCDALEHGRKRGLVQGEVMSDSVAAISVGVVNGRPLLDLDYSEDSGAEVDMNVAMTGAGKFIEVQGTAERRPFTPAELTALLNLARRGCRELTAFQQSALRRRPGKMKP
jgi:ribonuclease PH